MKPPNTLIKRISLHHCLSIKSGTISDTYISNNILNSYTKCREIYLAQNLFDEMPHKDSVSWNTMISSYVNCSNFDSALLVFNGFRRSGFVPDEYTFGSLLKGVGRSCRVDVGEQCHSVAIKTDLAKNVFSGSALLDMYAKCNRVEDAFAVFKCMPERNSVSWNALIGGFAKLGDRKTAFWLLDCMEREGLRIDDGTFAPLLTLLDDQDLYKLTMQVHAKIVKGGLEPDTTVCNASITSYSECGSLDDAKRVFDGAFEIRDLVTWNSMLAAYLAHNQGTHAFELFLELQRIGFEPDIYTYTSVISGCFEAAYQCHGKSLHGLVIKRGLEQLVPISNSLIAMYLKSNKNLMDEALKIFNSMEDRDRVSWNSILTGLSQISLSENCLQFFKHMRYELLVLDHYAFSAALRSCSDLATLQLGQQIHVLALKSGFHTNEYVASSLIFMYSKCGIIEDARRSFEETFQDSSIIWNSMIFGYAQHGEGKIALDLFNSMIEKMVKPDHISFVAILTACSHIGMLELGCNFLKIMESDFNIPPRMEHYACAIDLCGRAGRLDKAKIIIESMAFEPDAMVWKTLLGACRICGDIELAAQVAGHLLELEPEEHCTYVLLSNMYGNVGMWDDKARLNKLMKERGVKKVPGWSWIEVHNMVHAFNAEDHLHIRGEEIYRILDFLTEEMKMFELVGDLEVLKEYFSDDILSDELLLQFNC